LSDSALISWGIIVAHVRINRMRRFFWIRSFGGNDRDSRGRQGASSLFVGCLKGAGAGYLSFVADEVEKSVVREYGYPQGLGLRLKLIVAIAQAL